MTQATCGHDSDLTDDHREFLNTLKWSLVQIMGSPTFFMHLTFYNSYTYMPHTHPHTHFVLDVQLNI